MTRLVNLARLCLLTAGTGAAVLAVCGIWQLGAVIARLIELSQRAPVGPPFARAGATAEQVLPPVGTAADSPPASLVSVDVSAANRGHASAASFEAAAEASEHVIALGSGASWDEDEKPLPLGQIPPQTYPRRGDCDNVFVYIVTLVEGAPEHSAASLGLGNKAPARVRLPGERIGDWTVVSISDDWSGLNPGAWLEKGGAVCWAELAGNPARVHSPLKHQPRRAAPKRGRRARR